MDLDPGIIVHAFYVFDIYHSYMVQKKWCENSNEYMFLSSTKYGKCMYRSAAQLLLQF